MSGVEENILTLPLVKLETESEAVNKFTDVDLVNPVTEVSKLRKGGLEVSQSEMSEMEQVEADPEYGSNLYFRKLVVTETARIRSMCELWEEKLQRYQDLITEDIQGSIRATTGQGRLVMAERFAQFSGLIDNCEFKTGEKETTSTDLMGFWDMIYFQVEDVDKKFKKLSVVESLGWKEEIVPNISKKNLTKKSSTARKCQTKTVEASSGLRAVIAAKRMRSEMKVCKEDGISCCCSTLD